MSCWPIINIHEVAANAVNNDEEGKERGRMKMMTLLMMMLATIQVLPHPESPPDHSVSAQFR